MFEAPEIIKNIPDIKQIYDINEMQGDTLDQTVEQIDSDMNIDEMDASTVERWETILKIVPARSDTLDVRRFRIKTKITDSMPYTYRALERKLDDMCAGAYDIMIDRVNQSIKVNLFLLTPMSHTTPAGILLLPAQSVSLCYLPNIHRHM